MCSRFSEEDYNYLFDILKGLAVNSLENVNKDGKSTDG
jgi:hypothetical protein